MPTGGLMKMKNYGKYLMAPLSMVMIYSCSPNQYQQGGEYDDMYFTKADRKTQPQSVDLPPVQEADPSEVDLGYSGKATVSPEVLERYSTPEEEPLTYFELQGPEGAKVTSAKDLNYRDFLYDYENEHLAYYELPMDWDTDWNESSFNNLMVQDYQFRVAWYDQYYKGEGWRMDNYLSGRSTNTLSYADFMGPTVGLSVAATDFYSGFGYGVSYRLGMSFVDLNPYGFYDPFWRPIPRWRNSIYVGIGFGYGWNSWYNYNPWRPGWGGWYGPGYYNPRPSRPEQYYTANGRPVEYGPRLRSSSIASVRSDALNGSGTRSRSQRAVSASGGSANPRVARGGRVGSTSTRSTRATNPNITASRVNRVRTDDYRIGSGSSGVSRVTRSRVTAARSSSARANYRNTASGGSSSSRFTRSSVNRRSYNVGSGRSAVSSPTFNRSTSSGLSRSVMDRSNRSAYSRGFSGRNGSSYSRPASSTRPANIGRGNSSSSRSSGSGVSRSSSGGSRSGGVSSSRSSGSSRSGGSSRSSRGN
ncbi:hypothetical protein [Roseivirga pacifica]|uniref:hypothetical protein n=1 Tax=Roseivirga pacifica TaxID=1267423 RepID=UPI00227A85C4|nr:hypothetical protein [Roseivirga pacifica]